jgi:hypothetical protein
LQNVRIQKVRIQENSARRIAAASVEAVSRPVALLRMILLINRNLPIPAWPVKLARRAPVYARERDEL